MPPVGDEEKQLRSVALQNARSIRQVRRRAEEELIRAKAELELLTKELAGSLAILRATLESTTDAILVTDGTGRIVDFNARFVHMWGLSPDTLDRREHQEFVRFTGRLFEDPDTFRARIDDIYASAPPECMDLLELSDGRMIERFSRIQSVDGVSVGRVWSFRDITERLRAQVALQRQSEWLRITLSSIGDAVITTDTEGCVTSLNGVAESLTGWPASEALGLPLGRVLQIVDEQTREPIESPSVRSLREGCIVGLPSHAVLIARDGTERAIDDSAAPIRDEAGSVRGVIVIFRDVTERRRAEEAQLRLAAVVESSDDAIVSKSLEGIISTWNQGAERIFGYTADEITGKPINVLLPPGQDHEEADILARLRRGERLDHFETVRIHKEGRPINVSVTASPIRDASGRIIGASKIARDITHRVWSERSSQFLAAASAALAEMTDVESTLEEVASLAVPLFGDWCAIYLQEPDGSVRRVAVAHHDAAGLEVVEERARRFPSQPSDDFGIMKVLRTGEPEWAATISDSMLAGFAKCEEDLTLLRKLGLTSYICVPLRSRTEALGAVVFAIAGSSRIYDGDALRAAEDLADRTVIAIENANLLAAIKESDRRKDEFLAMLAHELRNPLAPIRSAVQLFRDAGPPQSELRWATDVIERQVHQMTRLVDDLMDVSRITSGKIQLQKARVELAMVVDGAVDASRPLIKKGGHEFTVVMPSEPIYLDADVTRLSQVVLNLLNNAAKYTNAGGQIWLTVRRDGRHLQLRVKDTGIGISTEMLPRVFDMFTQADPSLERSQGGLGIGLMLVKRITEMHGGTVQAHSDGPGTGSEFVVQLPIADEILVVRSAVGSGREELGATGSHRILIVDDNRDSADSLAILLRRRGNEVRIAHDGLEAVSAASEFEPDLVLLDIGLPGLNGYDAARRIRDESRNDLVLIAVTGWAQPEDRRRSKEAGFNHHLTKPVNLAALCKLIADIPARSARERRDQEGR